MEKEKRKTRKHFMQAFTLAEVLITISVIGVVAAMVMPSLSTNIQERTLETSRKVTERKIMMAVETMTNLDKMGGYKDTEEFVEQLRKHLNIVQVCSPDRVKPCWTLNGITDEQGNIISELPDSTSGERLFSMGGVDPSGRIADYKSKVVSFIMPDGTNVIMGYNTMCRTDGREPRNCVVLAFDTNGMKKPNSIGKDIFLINSRNFLGQYWGDNIDISSEKGETEVSGVCNGTGPCGNNGHGGQGGGQDGHDGNN